jgi:Mg2+/Co2+ transporter CorC
MVPRPQVRSLSSDATVAELVALIRENGNSNYPVYGQDMDDVIGVVGAREAAADGLAPSTPVSVIARPALMVPGSQPLYGVIDRMREAGEEFACVVDEYGGLAGILTFEDVAEELVGEITDENDARDQAPVGSADGSWLLDAGLRVDEIELTTGLALPEGDSYDTVGGLVMAELRRLPRPGDRLVVPLGEDPAEPDGHAEIEVVSVARRVAREVRVRALAAADAPTARGGEGPAGPVLVPAQGGPGDGAASSGGVMGDGVDEGALSTENADGQAIGAIVVSGEGVDGQAGNGNAVGQAGNGNAVGQAGSGGAVGQAVDANAMAASGEGPWTR